MKIIVVDTEEKAQTLLKCVEEKVFTITTLVIMNEPSDEVKQNATDNHVELLTFDDVLELGKENLKDFVVSCLYKDIVVKFLCFFFV